MRTASKALERQDSIRDLLLSKGTLTLSELCTAFNCSEATIRNDLTKLEKSGVLKRVLGGAVACENTSRNSGITKRMRIQNAEKNAIAEYVVREIIRPNTIITLDSGTTNMAIAQKLLDYKIPCTVITNSFIVATIASKSPNIQLCLAGGLYDAEHASFHDDVSSLILKSIRSEFAFISPNGISPNGDITNSGLTENAIKQQMIQQASKTIVLADHTKIGNIELKILCRVNDVFLIVTDSNATEAQLKILRNAGFNIAVGKVMA